MAEASWQNTDTEKYSAFVPTPALQPACAINENFATPEGAEFKRLYAHIAGHTARKMEKLSSRLITYSGSQFIASCAAQRFGGRTKAHGMLRLRKVVRAPRKCVSSTRCADHRTSATADVLRCATAAAQISVKQRSRDRTVTAAGSGPRQSWLSPGKGTGAGTAPAGQSPIAL